MRKSQIPQITTELFTEANEGNEDGVILSAEVFPLVPQTLAFLVPLIAFWKNSLRDWSLIGCLLSLSSGQIPGGRR